MFFGPSLVFCSFDFTVRVQHDYQYYTPSEHLEYKATYGLVHQFTPILWPSVCYVEGDPLVLCQVHEQTNIKGLRSAAQCRLCPGL